MIYFLEICFSFIFSENFFLFKLGFIANAIAVPILLSKEMTNPFNKMLAALSVVDNLFIVCSILEAIRKHIGKVYEYSVVDFEAEKNMDY